MKQFKVLSFAITPDDENSLENYLEAVRKNECFDSERRD